MEISGERHLGTRENIQRLEYEGVFHSYIIEHFRHRDVRVEKTLDMSTCTSSAYEYPKCDAEECEPIVTDIEEKIPGICRVR